MESRIILVDLAKSTKTELFRTPTLPIYESYFNGSCWTGESFIVLDPKTNGIKEIDLEGNERVVAVLPIKIVDAQSKAIYGTKVLLASLLWSNSYYFDVETEEMINCSVVCQRLSDSWDSGRIAVETENEFLLCVGTKSAAIDSPIQYADGIYPIYNRRVYALITKDNYWNGVPEYKEIGF